jgi:hypothetical protein
MFKMDPKCYIDEELKIIFWVFLIEKKAHTIYPQSLVLP